jgi:ACS family tartrate transporter-like MFS transporter
MDVATYRRIMLRVVLPLASLVVLSSIDRVNVSFAAIHMNADLGLDPKAYGFGVGLFFAGYLLFQLPSAAVLRRIGARHWIALSVIGWGSAATLMAIVQTPAHFYAARFLLGVFESGFAPGVVWYVSQWLPQAYRARAIGLTLLAIPTSVIIGGPLCGALLSIDMGAIPAWRMMFAVEGIATIAAGIIAWFWFVDRPEQARWLPQAERAAVTASLALEREQAGEATPRPMAETLRDPILWLSAAVWFVLITGANAIMFWLPIAIRTLGRTDPFEIGVLSALPWLAIGTGMLLNARHSDRTGERYRHLAIPTALAAIALMAAALAIGNGPLALGLLMLGGLGLGGAQSVFWTVPTQFVGAHNPTAIATINLFGNASGAVAPVVIGWVVATTGSVTTPVFGLSLLLIVGALLVLPLRRIGEARVAR